MATLDHFHHKGPRPFHFTRAKGNNFEFDPTATEVAILDRSGHPIWKKNRGEAMAPIRWDGIDATGRSVETGDYICKIVYPNEKVTYLPFVFMKRS